MKKTLTEGQIINIIKESISDILNETYNGPLYTTLTLAELVTAVKNDKMVADDTGVDSSIVLSRNKVIKYSFDSAIVDDTAIICVLKFSAEKLANLRNNRITPMSPKNMDGEWDNKAKQSGLNLALEKLSVKEIAPLSQYVDSIMIDLSKTEGDVEPIKATYYDLDSATKNEIKIFAKENGIKTKDAVLQYIISMLKNNPKFGSKIAVTGGNMLTKNIFGHNDFVDDEPEVQPAINENKLKQLIKESVKKAFNESIYGDDNFTSTTTMDNLNNNDDEDDYDEDRERELEVAYRLERYDELPDIETVGVELGERDDEGTYVNHSNNPHHPYISIYVYHPGRDAFYDLTANVMINGREERIEWKDMSEKMKCDIEEILGLR
jgi:hypothetical protein